MASAPQMRQDIADLRRQLAEAVAARDAAIAKARDAERAARAGDNHAKEISRMRGVIAGLQASLDRKPKIKVQTQIIEKPVEVIKRVNVPTPCPKQEREIADLKKKIQSLKHAVQSKSPPQMVWDVQVIREPAK